MGKNNFTSSTMKAKKIQISAAPTTGICIQPLLRQSRDRQRVDNVFLFLLNY